VRKPRKIKCLLAGTFVLILLAVWAIVAPLLADLLVVERPIAKADAIVVLSGAADYKQRAEGGAAAFRNGIAPLILVTDDDQRGGWDDTEKGNPLFVERTIKVLKGNGVNSNAIEKLQARVHGTDDEADLVIRTAAERGYTSILLVTSEYHSRRALWTFEQFAANSGLRINFGIQCSPSSANYPGRATWWLSARGWRTVGAEYLKFGYYWLYY